MERLPHLRKLLREKTVLRGRERHAPLEEDPAVEDAEDREHRDDRDHLAPQVPPKMTFAPSANGLVDFASVELAIIPRCAAGGPGDRSERLPRHRRPGMERRLEQCTAALRKVEQLNDVPGLDMPRIPFDRDVSTNRLL